MVPCRHATPNHPPGGMINGTSTIAQKSALTARSTPGASDGTASNTPRHNTGHTITALISAIVLATVTMILNMRSTGLTDLTSILYHGA